MVIQTNVSALISYRESAKTTRAMKKNLEKLSSGYRINRSADDASGLAVSERMRIYCTEYGRCLSNAKEGVNLAKTADGALAEVNDMLRRARELCIQAENGTYSEQELASISDEMNQLFSEVDRITEGSFFNEIQLFRGKQGPDFHYEYDETYAALPVPAMEEWGEMDFVQTEKFKDPPQAKVATASFKLDDNIKFDDVSTLNGRTVKFNNGTYDYTYYFTDGTVNPPTSASSYTRAININTYHTTESALNELAQRAMSISGGPTSVVIDKDARTMTMTARLGVKDDGSFMALIKGNLELVQNFDSQGSGSWKNGAIAAQNVAGTSSLEQVDGEGANNNLVTYSDDSTASLSLANVSSTLTADDVKYMQRNTLSVGNYTIKLSDLNPYVGMTQDTFGTNLANLINTKLGANSATYDSTSKRIEVKRNTPGSAPYGYISETTVDKKTEDKKTPLFTSPGLKLDVIPTRPPSAEVREQYTITVPSLPSDKTFSLYINGTEYMYYDSSAHSLDGSGYDGIMYDGSKYSSPYKVNTRNMNESDIIKDIANKLCPSTRGQYSINGNTITATANSVNTAMGLSSSPTSIKVEGYKTETVDEGTSSVIGAGASFSKTATIPFALGTVSDISKLAGKGFSIGSGKWEFSNGTGVHNDYTDIDISGCSTFEQLKDKVQNAMGSSYAVEIDTTDSNNAKLKISFTTASAVTVKDGLAGIKNLISGNEPVKYDGGSDIGYSEVQIDFSSINSSNLDELLGKGFRINCATCTGEYINIFFCWENNGQVPESFKVDADTGERLPDDADITKENVRVINNFSVELSKVTSGDQIVQSIVDQVKSSLKHFTDVDVGSPPTVLVARDKRLGGAKVNNVFVPAEVVSGLKTNFTYSVNIRKVEEYPEDGSVAMKENIVDIYVGSEPDPQIIPIHLPYIDLKTLRLSPPETVDLNAADQDASGWLDRVDQANLAISKFRGVIGADHNRLEHAVQALSHAKENVTDAESRIRDTDMAEEMMEHVKLQILTQSQQSMLSQALSQPQQVLRLIS